MKRSLITSALVLVLGTGAALAQQAALPPDGPQGPPPPRHMRRPPNPEQQVKHLTKALGLTPDQAAKLEPVFANRDAQMKAIHDNGQLTQQSAREQLHALQQSTEQQIAGILTPEQLQQFKQMHHGPGGPRGPHGPGGWQGGPQGQPQPSGL